MLVSLDTSGLCVRFQSRRGGQDQLVHLGPKPGAEGSATALPSCHTLTSSFNFRKITSSFLEKKRKALGRKSKKYGMDGG